MASKSSDLKTPPVFTPEAEQDSEDDIVILHRFRVTRELKASPDSRVYIAVDTCSPTSESVIVKATRTAETSLQPRQEAILLRGPLLGCPGVPRVVVEERDADHDCDVLVLAPVGLALDTLISSVQELPASGPHWRQLLLDSCERQLVMTLREVHKRGVVHRDIKPGNIIRCLESHAVQFIDFGGGTTDPKSPQLVVTSAYASDRVKSGSPGSYIDDWISLGYTLWALSSGALAKFEEESIKGNRPSISEIAKRFPCLALHLEGTSCSGLDYVLLVFNSHKHSAQNQSLFHRLQSDLCGARIKLPNRAILDIVGYALPDGDNFTPLCISDRLERFALHSNLLLPDWAWMLAPASPKNSFLDFDPKPLEFAGKSSTASSGDKGAINDQLLPLENKEKPSRSFVWPETLDKLPQSVCLRRLCKEMQSLEEKRPTNVVCAVVDNKDPLRWEICLSGPAGSPYADGRFALSFQFPKDFPYKPPLISFKTPIFHPNVNEGSQLDMPELFDQWSPGLTVDRLLERILAWMATPDLDYTNNPDTAKMYQDDRDKFNKTAAEWTKQHASLAQSKAMT